MSLMLIITGAAIGTVTAAVGVSAVLILTSSPSPCVDREVLVSASASQELRQKWNAFKAQSTSGTASVTFNESEVTSRAAEFIRAQGIELEKLQVFFCENGNAEATATFVGGGPELDLLARGSLDLSGALPRIEIEDILVGSMPGIAPINGLVSSLQEETQTLNLGVNLTSVTITDGQAILQAAP